MDPSVKCDTGKGKHNAPALNSVFPYRRLVVLRCSATTPISHGLGRTREEFLLKR